MQLGGNSLACLLRPATIKQKKILLLNVKQRNEVVRKSFLLRPQNLSPPALPRLTGSTLIPTRQLPLRLSFPFPLALLGPVTAQALSLYRDGFFRGYVAPYLIWLLSLPVRPSPLLIRRCAVCTFDLDVALALDAPACTHSRWAGEVALTKAHR